MAKIRLTSYTFDASAQTIVAGQFSDVGLAGIQLITNVTDGIIIYNFADPTKGGSLSTDTLTLEYDTTSMSDTDELMILVEDGVASTAINDGGNSITVDGTITANLSATDNTVLDNIDASTAASATSLSVLDDWDNGASDGVSVSGDTAHDAVDAGEPVKIGGKALTGTPTPVANADRVNAWFNEYGQLVTSDYDVEVGSAIGSTGLRDRLMAQRYTVLADSLADGLAGFWTSTTANGGTTTSSGGEGLIQTTAAATGSAQLSSTTATYFPGQVGWFNSAVRFNDTGSAGNTRRIGVFTVSGTTPQDGFYYELSGTTLNAVVAKAGTPTAVASDSWSRVTEAPFTLDTNYHSLEIRYTANTVWFYVDNVLRHKVSGTNAAITATLNFPITIQSINASGATNRFIAVRNCGIGRFGNPEQPVSESGLSAVSAVAIGGGTPHDSVDSGNPLKIGGYAKATAPSTVADGDRVNAWFSQRGAMVVENPTAANLNITEASAANALTALQLIDDTVFVDDTATHATGTTKVLGIGAVASPTDTTLNANDIGMPGMSNTRELWSVIRDAAGNGRGANVNASNQLTTIDANSASALTALQLIDNPVQVLGTDTYTEATSSGFTLGAVRRDADTTLVNTTNEFAPLQVDARGALKVEAFSGETLPVSFTGSTDVATQTTLASLLTSSQLIDDVVYTDDTSTHATGTSKGALIMAAATPTDTAVNANDIGAVAMTNNREMYVSLRDISGTAAVNGSGTATGALRMELANNGTGTIASITTSVVPGTAATNLGKAEDAGHTSGDVGVAALGVRVDTPNVALTNTDADYGNIALNKLGSVRMAALEDDLATAATKHVYKYYTNSGAVTDGIVWSPAAGARWFLTLLTINVSAACTVTIEDDVAAGDVVRYKAELAANSGVVLPFGSVPMFSGEDAADLLITTTAGNVYVTAVGYEI